MSPPSKQKQARQAAPVAATERLLAAGLRVTYARVQVLEVLEKASRAVSHADIESFLATPIDKVTLYRTLDRLLDAKLIHKTVGADRITRFATLDGAQHAQHAQHAHFHCDDCGMVYCLDLKVPKVLKVPEGFNVETLDFSVHGHCANCTQPEVKR
jgi:Fur family transcriptional regulator, ferric uptake regulator